MMTAQFDGFWTERSAAGPITAFNTADQALHHLGAIALAIITDIRMPGMSGLEFLRQVKEAHRTHYCYDSPLDLQALSPVSNEELEYLPKPFDVDDAVAVVRRAIAQTEEVKSTHP